jgi:hypothetical protein
MTSPNQKSDFDNYPRPNIAIYIERIIFFIISWSFSMIILSETLSSGSAVFFSTFISSVVIIVLLIGRWE